jgi:mRNA interferase MazF
MPGYEVWDIVKVPFPYTNRPIQQRRPALVVAVPNVPGAPDLLWVLMVTSAANRAWPGDVVISDLAVAGLPAASVVRSAKIATIEVQDVERIGALARDDRPQIVAPLRQYLDGSGIVLSEK